MGKAPAAIAVSPVASPSSPSVRFTALELPVTTTVTNTTYRGGQNGSNQYLNRGTCVDATGWMFGASGQRDRKSTRLNSSHDQISYAVFCLKKKTTNRRARVTADRAGYIARHAHAAARKGGRGLY